MSKPSRPKASSKGAAGGGGAADAKQGIGTPEQGEQIAPTTGLKSINVTQAKADFMSRNDPTDFMPHNAPDSIVINGIEFKRIGATNTLYDDKWHLPTYLTQYQSTKQATNGEWPVFQAAAQCVKKGKKQVWQWDTSTSGTGFW